VSSPIQRILAQLVLMAEMRQATVSKQTLKVYSTRLVNEARSDARGMEAVEGAIIAIAERPRREGETAFPDLGTILHEVEIAKLRIPLLPEQINTLNEQRAAELAARDMNIQSVRNLLNVGESSYNIARKLGMDSLMVAYLEREIRRSQKRVTG
jgi:hypothetical protein